MREMTPLLEERLIFIPVITGIFVLLSFGYMFLAGGATPRLKAVGFCSTIFIAGAGYCMSWRKEIAAYTGWDDAWTGAALVVAIASFFLCRAIVTRQSKQNSNEVE